MYRGLPTVRPESIDIKVLACPSPCIGACARFAGDRPPRYGRLTGMHKNPVNLVNLGNPDSGRRDGRIVTTSALKNKACAVGNHAYRGFAACAVGNRAYRGFAACAVVNRAYRLMLPNRLQFSPCCRQFALRIHWQRGAIRSVDNHIVILCDGAPCR